MNRRHLLKIAGATLLPCPPVAQPEPTAPAQPLDTIASHVQVYGQSVTVIARTWAVQDRPTCGGLCASGCNFRNGHCQVAVAEFVPLAEVSGYGLEGASVPRLAIIV